MRLPRLPVSRRRHEARTAELELRVRELYAGSRHLKQRIGWAEHERDKAHRYGYAEGMRWTCHQAGHPVDGPWGQCICGVWAHHVEADAVEVEL